MKRILFLLTIVLLGAACEKIDPFAETDEGKNILGFYLDGTKVSYETSGGFPSEYPYKHCVYARKINADSLEISALLDNYYYDQIMMKLAISDIATSGRLKNPEIMLRCFYRMYPIAPDLHIDGGARKEYAWAEATEGEIRFRKWDPETGILSGNFEFTCDATQFDGSVKHLSITEGNFDVRFND